MSTVESKTQQLKLKESANGFNGRKKTENN